MNNIWTKIGNTPIDYASVASLFPDYKCKYNKVSALEKKGDIIRLKQGLYVPNPELSGKQLSLFMIGNNLYGPSYISLQSALRYYGLIPERVYTICSMTIKRSQMFYNDLARFEYVHVDKEVCPLGLAPTTSTTATLLMGDALMVCLMEKHQFKAENFAVYHPGGALGRQLLGRVKNLMTTNVPRVNVNESFKNLVHEMSDKHLGMTMVYDGKNCIGIITDGDLRRAIQKYDDLHITARDVMTPSYKHIHKDALLSDALAIMDKYNITTLAVTEKPDSKDIIGIISIHHIIDFN